MNAMAVCAMKEGVSRFKRGLVLNAAAKLFFERGYAATTVDAIADELRASKRAIYDISAANPTFSSRSASKPSASPLILPSALPATRARPRRSFAGWRGISLRSSSTIRTTSRSPAAR
jgi:hypothetical protein